MKTEIITGITYSKPQVTLLQETGIGTSEVAARSCYDSFDNSENVSVEILDREFDALSAEPTAMHQVLENINDIEHSNLLDDLAWTYFHHSIMEHANLTYLIRGTSRAVLQEHARHRIQAISVRSTRYTMSNILNAFMASLADTVQPIQTFAYLIKTMDMFILTTNDYINIEIEAIYNKLKLQRKILGEDAFKKLAIAKSSLQLLNTISDPHELFRQLQAGKNKRNVGDAFKHIVTDNFKCDLVVTFNLRSLKNYIDLRASNSAYFQIQWLAEEMIKVTPRKYLDLIIKQDKLNKILGE